MSKNVKISVIGMGYVGLPLAYELSKSYSVIGYDIKKDRIEELSYNKDSTLELSSEDLMYSKIDFSSDPQKLDNSNIYIVTVPTPLGEANTPDLSPLIGATSLIAEMLKVDDIVIYESTVYPGATEEVCVPILENISGLVFNKDFSVGYSPERINPGDKVNTLRTIKKIVSASNQNALDVISEIYSSVVDAGISQASSIKVAEAAKVIENTQRDVNIAFVNELALLFDRLGLDTNEVLEAASTKWNFLHFKPGLVGGHCIGVDPYYLTHKAEMVGYHPEIILSGRRINDSMGKYIAQRTIKKLVQSGNPLNKYPVIIFGATFKENCPDLRNSRVKDIYDELENYGLKVEVYDPVCNFQELKRIYGDSAKAKLSDVSQSQAAVVAVSHRDFNKEELLRPLVSGAVVVDVKALFKKDELKDRGYVLWRL